jgi:hypothetical protein
MFDETLANYKQCKWFSAESWNIKPLNVIQMKTYCMKCWKLGDYRTFEMKMFRNMLRHTTDKATENVRKNCLSTATKLIIIWSGSKWNIEFPTVTNIEVKKELFFFSLILPIPLSYLSRMRTVSYPLPWMWETVCLTTCLRNLSLPYSFTLNEDIQCNKQAHVFVLADVWWRGQAGFDAETISIGCGSRFSFSLSICIAVILFNSTLKIGKHVHSNVVSTHISSCTKS